MGTITIPLWLFIFLVTGYVALLAHAIRQSLARRRELNAIGEPTENVTHLFGSTYIVRTQAGFKKARRRFLAAREMFGCEIEGFPTSYPSVVTFNVAYRGYHYATVSCVHLNKLITKMIPHIHAAHNFQDKDQSNG